MHCSLRCAIFIEKYIGLYIALYSVNNAMNVAWQKIKKVFLPLLAGSIVCNGIFAGLYFLAVRFFYHQGLSYGAIFISTSLVSLAFCALVLRRIFKQFYPRKNWPSGLEAYTWAFITVLCINTCGFIDQKFAMQKNIRSIADIDMAHPARFYYLQNGIADISAARSYAYKFTNRKVSSTDMYYLSAAPMLNTGDTPGHKDHSHIWMLVANEHKVISRSMPAAELDELLQEFKAVQDSDVSNHLSPRYDYLELDMGEFSGSAFKKEIFGDSAAAYTILIPYSGNPNAMAADFPMITAIILGCGAIILLIIVLAYKYNF